jgi:hypothetical protein
MLYIKCKISFPENVIAFQKFYKYLLKDKKEVYQMKAYEDFMDLEDRLQERALKLYDEYFPLKAQSFINDFLEYEGGFNEIKGESITSLFSYLDVDFEVDFTNLVIENDILCINFSTGNYPYGGMRRFLMVIKAFGGEPIECFNGFDVYEFKWTSKYEHKAKVLKDKTKSYLNLHNN